MSYIPITESDREAMLAAVGASSVEELFADIPAAIRERAQMSLPEPLREPALLRHMQQLSARNRSLDELVCFLGAGIYDHFIPSIVLDVLSRPEFKTGYTPYQAERSQGMLQTIYEYQTMICELTAMDAANASMYDGATALAEAILMAASATRRSRALVANTLHPLARSVVETYSAKAGVSVEEIGYDHATGLTLLDGHDSATALIGDDVACIAAQQPNFFGLLEPMADLAELTHSHGALLIASVDPISLGILKPPGEYGADIAVGEGQALGLPPGFGGPLLGIFACRESLLRRMPGRVAGRTVDADGRPAYCLTLQTREQHIRRERATSNICTNEALCALAAGAYLAALGKEGIREIATLCAQKAHYAFEAICELDRFEPIFSAPFFKEFAVKCPGDVTELNRRLLDEDILGGLPLGRYYPELGDNAMLLCVTEQRTREEIEALVDTLGTQ